MPVRISEIPGLNPTQINAAPMSARAAGAPGAALGEFAEGIAAISQPFAQIAGRIQQVENGRLESEARNKWSSDFAKLTLDLQKDPEPGNHLRKVEEFLDASQAAFDVPGLPPIVRDRLMQDHAEFATKAKMQVARDAAALEARRADLAFQNEASEAMRTNDRAGFGKALATRSKALGAPPEEEAAEWQKFDRNSSLLGIENDIETDPIGAKKRLESDDFLASTAGVTDQDRRRALRQADATIEAKRAEQMDLLEDALSYDKLEPDDIEAAEFITDRDRASIIDALGQKDPPSNETHGKAWGLLGTLRVARADPSITPEQYQSLWNEARGSVLRRIAPRWQGDIRQELSNLSPAGRSTDPAQIVRAYEKGDLEAEGRDIAYRARAAGLFGKIDEDATPEQKEKSYRKAEDIRLAVKRFVAGNPEATPEEVREFTDNLISGDRIKTSAREFQNFVPGGAQRLRPLPSMAPGPGFTSDALLPKKQLEEFLK